MGPQGWMRRAQPPFTCQREPGVHVAPRALGYGLPPAEEGWALVHSPGVSRERSPHSSHSFKSRPKDCGLAPSLLHRSAPGSQHLQPGPGGESSGQPAMGPAPSCIRPDLQACMWGPGHCKLAPTHRLPAQHPLPSLGALLFSLGSRDGKGSGMALRWTCGLVASNLTIQPQQWEVLGEVALAPGHETRASGLCLSLTCLLLAKQVLLLPAMTWIIWLLSTAGPPGVPLATASTALAGRVSVCLSQRGLGP